MLNWAKEVIMDTVVFQGGIGFITSNGHIIGFRQLEVPRGARKIANPPKKVEVSFIAMNTIETPIRPDKEVLVEFMQQLGLDHTFKDLTNKRKIFSSFSGNNELRIFEDADGSFYKLLERAEKDIFEEGWSSRKRINPDYLKDCPYKFGAALTVTKSANTYSIISSTSKMLVSENQEGLNFRFIHLDEEGKEHAINLDEGFADDILVKLHVKGSPNWPMFMTTNGGLMLLIEKDANYIRKVVNRLENRFVHFQGLALDDRQKMKVAVRKAKQDSNPFAALADFKKKLAV